MVRRTSARWLHHAVSLLGGMCLVDLKCGNEIEGQRERMARIQIDCQPLLPNSTEIHVTVMRGDWGSATGNCSSLSDTDKASEQKAELQQFLFQAEEFPSGIVWLSQGKEDSVDMKSNLPFPVLIPRKLENDNNFVR